MARVMLVGLPSRKLVYLETNVRVGAPSYPCLTLATLAGHLIDKYQVKIVDLDLVSNAWTELKRQIRSFKPDIVAISAKTPSYPAAVELMSKVKKTYPKITIIIGGVHATICQKEVLRAGCFDIVVVGEADFALPTILSKKNLNNFKGKIYYDKKSPVKNLDDLPLPAWELFDLNKYQNSRLSCRQNPSGLLETSRGCAYRCNFCCKDIFGTNYRMKSPKRVVDEMAYMFKCGFREIHIADDSFTQDIGRAKEICREIIKRKLNFPWSLINGVRVNFVDREFFRLAKKAGCWQVGFGIESGDQRVLNKVGKGTKLIEILRAVKQAEEEGIETFGFFILGLLGETEKSMAKTIKFAKSLPLSTAKFDLCIPYPGTSYYKLLETQGRILSREWSAYRLHQIEKPLFKHQNLSWETIGRYYQRAFKEFYFRPSYVWQRLKRDLRQGDLLHDLGYLLKSRW